VHVFILFQLGGQYVPRGQFYINPLLERYFLVCTQFCDLVSFGGIEEYIYEHYILLIWGTSVCFI